MPSYNPADVERRWQQYWLTHKTFRTPDPGEPGTAGKPKFYVLDMFPYPSGAGLHVGHPEGYTATDILARYKRMNGYHVLHPMGWDAFGLPAEQYAVEKNIHPRITTRQNIATFRQQIQSLGFSYDWDREVDTTDPKYYKWTQWIFLQLYDTWYDREQKRGRPISELPIPPEIASIRSKAKREAAIRRYRDSRRLAYMAEVPVNWCPALGTVLANEEVIDGKSERGGHPVERRPLRQWMLRITDYADRLLEDLDLVDWPESIKKMQREWIGRSEGAEVRFRVGRGQDSVTVFTTRPDTLFGATYLVLAPEHPLVPKLTTRKQKSAVEAYVAAALARSERDRTTEVKVKTGVFTGSYAVNPVNDQKIPVWVADYVLGSYGTGAIMAVPAHDQRDFEFAQQFGLPVVPVVRPPEAWLEQTGSTPTDFRQAYCDDGVAINSGPLDGLPTPEAKQKIIAWLEERQLGARKVNYKLRDWLFSRQRYWGEPFPLLHELAEDDRTPTGTVYPVLESLLPLRLPEVEDFRPTGRPEPLLEKAQDWVWVQCGDRIRYKRETNTMPQWAGSCWYYLRYIDPHNDTAFADPEKLKYWLPVDLYVGGAEHAVLHLLYARFWHKVLYDRGLVPCPEPFRRLVNQGMILGEHEYHLTPQAYQTHRDQLAQLGLTAVPRDDGQTYVVQDAAGSIGDEWVEKKKGKTYLKGTDIEVTGRADKMSKSRGNVVNPDDIIRQYGADSLRLYEMFMGPLTAVKAWNTRSIEGVYRFLNRVWRLVVDEGEELKPHPAVQDVPPDRDTLRQLHRTIQKVTEDTENLAFNTAISEMMTFANHLAQLEVRPRAVLEPFILLLAPYAPHIAEELWRVLGHSDTLAYEPWPKYDPELAKEEEIEIALQVNGKVKSRLRVPADIDDAALEATALADAAIQAAIAGKTIKMVKVVPQRLVNVVVS